MNDYEKRDAAQTHKRVISVVLSFLLFLFLTFLAFLLCIYFNVFESKAVFNALEKSNYYAGVSEEFETLAWDTTIPLGLPETIVKGLVDEVAVKRDIDTVVENSYRNIGTKVDTNFIVDEIDLRVRKHFSDKGKDIAAEQETVFNTYKQTLANEYIALTNFAVLNFIGGIKVSYSKLIFFSVIALLVGILICTAIIFAIRKHKHRAIRFVIYSTMASAVATAILPLICFTTGFHTRIRLSPAYLRDFTVSMINSSLLTMLLSSGIFVVLSIILFITIAFLKRKYFGRRHAH